MVFPRYKNFLFAGYYIALAFNCLCFWLFATIRTRRGVWAPFVFENHLALSTITGRLAHLLNTTPVGLLPNVVVLKPDPRLVIPLCAIVDRNTKMIKIDDEVRKELRHSNDEQTDLKISNLQSLDSVDLDHLPLADTEALDFNNQTIETLSNDLNWRQLMQTLPDKLCFQLLDRLVVKSVSPTENDWRNLFQMVEYQFTESWHVKMVKGLFVLVLLLGLWQQVWTVINSAEYLSRTNVIPAASMRLGILSVWLLLSEKLNIDIVWMILLVFTLSGIPVFSGILGTITNSAIFGVVFSVILPNKANNTIFDVIFGTIFGAIFGAISGAIFSVTGAIVGAAFSAILGAIAGAFIYWPTELLLSLWPISIGNQLLSVSGLLGY